MRFFELAEGSPALHFEGVDIQIEGLSEIPLYDADIEEHGLPAPVQWLVDQISKADAVLIATPEYNYSIPGVLKNAIDWVSRAEGQPFNGKAIAIMGASMGGLGTSRSHETDICLPERHGHERTRSICRCCSYQGTRDFLVQYLIAVQRWAERIGQTSVS